MPVINVTLPSDGTTADVGDYNSVITAMLATINGLLDDDNIASLSGTKIIAGTLPATASSATARQGWETGQLAAPNTVTYLGQRSYSLVFSGTDYTPQLSAGMRLRTTRTVNAPIQSTSLNGTTQYYLKSSPNKMTFTDDFAVNVWIKLNNYTTSPNNAAILGRYNGTSGWYAYLEPSGQVTFVGKNAGVGNYRGFTTAQSVPVGKWTCISLQLDMSSYTATNTTMYAMFDGVDVPVNLITAGTNPTALVQAGNFEIGSYNGGTNLFPGKIAQVAVFNAKVSQTTMRTYMSQGLTGSETSLASAYSFNNSILDLNTTTPNDLSVGGGAAVATNLDSPFGQKSGGLSSLTWDFGIISSVSFATDTTVVVQVPEGCTIPTSGGVASIAYSGISTPYAFPKETFRWQLATILRVQTALAVTISLWYNLGSGALNVPAGSWTVGYSASPIGQATTTSQVDVSLSTANNTVGDTDFTTTHYIGSTQLMGALHTRKKPLVLSSLAPYYLNFSMPAGTGLTIYNTDTVNVVKPVIIEAYNNYL